jgi:type II secretory pathway component PulF
MSEGEKLDVLDLASYTRSLAVMMSAGVSLIRQLRIAEETFREPLKSVTAMLISEVEAGSTLSTAMTKRSDVFSRVFAQMVRVGEVGGVLDETLLQLADLLEKDWVDASPEQKHRGWLVPTRGPEPSFADAPPEDQVRLISLYFRSLGTMLSAGVPRDASVLWDTAAGLLPPGPERDALAAISETVREAGRLQAESFRLPFVSGIALQLASIGIETNTFPLVCEKIAQLLEYQRKYYLLKNRG